MKVSDLGDTWFAAYKHCLSNYMLWEAAAIARHYRPTRIYKYFSFDSVYWRKNGKEGEVAFSLPSAFNDPSDSRWFLDYEKIIDERLKGEEETAKSLVGEDIFKVMIGGYEEDFMYLQDMFWVACFSETPYSNLMWGHYAAKHTGFCVEYDVTKLPETMSLLLPVVYCNRPFDASLLIDKQEITDQHADLCPSLFKSSDWRYEKEWRVFVKHKENEDRHVEKAAGAISGLYFGFRSLHKNKERTELESWAKSNSIPCYQIERTYRSFDFTSDNIEDIRAGKPMKGFVL